jgi:hypothetical protein
MSMMYSAYWGEPYPLKVQYPERWDDSMARTIRIITVFLAIIAFIVILPIGPFAPRSFLSFVIRLLVSFLLLMILYRSAVLVGNWHYAIEWKSAFVQNNADLEIDYRAIQRVIRYFTLSTGWRGVGFRKVAIQVAASLRKERPFARSLSWNWHPEVKALELEINHAYCHFAFSDKELLRPRYRKNRHPRLSAFGNWMDDVTEVIFGGESFE